jgi:hypothetical protein
VPTRPRCSRASLRWLCSNFPRVSCGPYGLALHPRNVKEEARPASPIRHDLIYAVYHVIHTPQFALRPSVAKFSSSSKSPRVLASKVTFASGRNFCGLVIDQAPPSSKRRSAFRSFFVFFFLSSSSHLAGDISPLVLHHRSPVHMPSIFVPSASQTRTAFRTFGLGASTACGGMSVSFIQGAKRESRGTVKRAASASRPTSGRREELLRVGG